MRIAFTLAGALSVLAALSSCGSDEPPQTPIACLAPSPVYLEALEAAPGEVRLDRTTPISSCLVEEQASGPLQTVGQSAVEAATELNAEIREDPDPVTIVRLGYLVGAMRQAAAATSGIHEDLVLRLESAARFRGEGEKPFDAGFERAFGEGYAAGQTNG